MTNTTEQDSRSPIVGDVERSPGETLKFALLALVGLCQRDGIGELDITMNEVTSNGQPAGDWRLRLNKVSTALSPQGGEGRGTHTARGGGGGLTPLHLKLLRRAGRDDIIALSSDAALMHVEMSALHELRKMGLADLSQEQNPPGPPRPTPWVITEAGRAALTFSAPPQGGIIAWEFEVADFRHIHTGEYSGWRKHFSTHEPSDNPCVRNKRPLYTSPAPAQGWQLVRALHILALVYTDDDADTGFRINIGATPEYKVASHEFVSAWRTVREHLQMQTEQPAAPAHPQEGER